MSQTRTKVSKTTKTKASKKATNKTDSALAICPVDGAGWCPYPFSVSQLKKRLKRLQEESSSKQTKNLSVAAAK